MVNVVIGSWGSYNACNERALGSKWLDLSDYDTWEEIAEELKKEGFKLNGIDEELFIQDVEGLPSDCMNWDYSNPQSLFETLKESGALDDSDEYDTMCAFLEVRSWDEFEDLVGRRGNRWDEDMTIYRGFSWEDYGREIFDTMCYDIPDHLMDYFDFENYGRSMGIDCAEEYSNGIIEIRR